MDNMKIIKKRMRYIVPFGMCAEDNTNIHNIINELDGCSDEYGGIWKQESVHIREREQDVYEYILDSFGDGDHLKESNIGSYFSYKPNPAGAGLPKITYTNSVKDYQTQQIQILAQADFEITEIGLFLFNTGIGLLWYEISDIDLTVEALAVFNSQFKELTYPKNYFLFKSADYPDFLMGDYITRILKPIDCELQYYSSRPNPSRAADAQADIPDKARLFNYVVCDSGEDYDAYRQELIRMAYYMSKGYKSTYKVLPGIENQMFHPYDNAYWCVSEEGSGYYLFASENNKRYYTGDKGLTLKVMDDYFLIYILVLQQEYTLLKFAEMIAENLSANPDKYLDSQLYDDSDIEREKHEEFLQLEKQIHTLTTKVNVFLTKNVRASVSHVQAQNDLYLYARKQLNILGDIKDLTMGLESLQELLHDARQKWESEEEGTRDKRLNTILSLFTVVAFLSAIYDGESLVKDFFMPEEGTARALIWDTASPYGIFFIVLTVIWAVIILCLIVNMVPGVQRFFSAVGRRMRRIFRRKRKKK